MQIRASQKEDITAIMRIYEKARAFMDQTGNPTQWGDGYPQQDLIEEDLQQGHSYVCEENGQPYGTIHRVASDGTAKGVAGACFDFCKEKADYLRIDTHADNRPMQAAVLRYGFRQCGIIYTRDGSPRIAYDYLVK